VTNQVYKEGGEEHPTPIQAVYSQLEHSGHRHVLNILIEVNRFLAIPYWNVCIQEKSDTPISHCSLWYS